MSVGYPDYSRTQAEAGNQLGSFFGQKQTDPTTGIMDCIGYAFLTIQVNDTANVHHFAVDITWYGDKAGTNIVNTSDFVPTPGSNISYQIPSVARYGRVTISHQVGGDTEVVGGLVFGSNVQVATAIVGPKSGPLINASATLGAGASQSFNALYTVWGAAVLYGSTSSGSSYVVQLMYYDLVTASFKVLVSLNGVTVGTGFAARVALPPNPIQVTIINTDTVTRTVIGELCLE
jgi:hypothetical protein